MPDTKNTITEAEKFDSWPLMKKHIAEGMFARRKAEIEREKLIRELFAENDRLGGSDPVCSIVWFSDDIQLVELRVPRSYHGDFYNNQETYWACAVKGRRSSSVALDEEDAILIALADKYDGINSQFPSFALRMLGKKPAGEK